MNSAGDPANSSVTLSDISGDGRFVLFESYSATNLGRDNNNHNIHIPYSLHDRDKDKNGIYDEPGLINTQAIRKPPRHVQFEGSKSFVRNISLSANAR